MRVCLVGHSAAGLLAASANGSERQTALLARQLASRGHEVSLVVTGLRGGECLVDGVRVIPAWDPDRGARFVRALVYRYPRLYRILRSEHADVYYARRAGYYTPFVVRAARDGGAKSLLALASDRDLYPSSRSALFAVSNSPLSPVVAWLAHAVYRYWALPAATCVVVQNREQAAACTALRLRNAVLPSIVMPPPAELTEVEPQRDAVWAGNVHDGRRSKGLEALAGLAVRSPHVSFTVAGALEGESHRPAIELLRNMTNVRLTGELGHTETQRAIAAHRLVLNTSPSEGFSNVMLEAWALGRPCVTLAVNPSGLLTGDHLGICAGGDLDTMVAAVSALLAEPEVRAAMGERGREYVRETHSPGHVCDTFERLVAD